MKVVVLGCGLVGGPVAADLAPDFEVTAVDVNPGMLSRASRLADINIVQADLSNPEMVSTLVSGADFAVNAVPGSMGYKTLEAIILAGVKVIDIAFMPEDVMQLNSLAVEKNCTVISDMGVAPGMSNLLAGYAEKLLDTYEKLEIYVGGLPKVRTWPWEYKAVFSPADVVEEYTRPARLVRNGRLVVMPALSDQEKIEIEGVGTLEAFNSDGLRSLVHTLSVPDMIEKTMRYPGHAGLMQVLNHAGFFAPEPMQVGQALISPLTFTSKLLFSQWKLNEGEEDITVMKIIAKGLKDGQSTTITWSLFDTYDRQTGVHSMARTTGYAATSALRMLAKGMYAHAGVHVPEFIGRHPECVRFMLNEQRKRGVIYEQTMIQV